MGGGGAWVCVCAGGGVGGRDRRGRSGWAVRAWSDVSVHAKAAPAPLPRRPL